VTAPLRKVLARAVFLKSAELEMRAGQVIASKKYAVRLRLECGHRIDVPITGNTEGSKRCKECVSLKTEAA
jgi:hypothetical protein